MFDQKFLAVVLGFVVLIIFGPMFSVVSLHYALSSSIIGILFYMLGRYDESKKR